MFMRNNSVLFINMALHDTQLIKRSLIKEGMPGNRLTQQNGIRDCPTQQQTLPLGPRHVCSLLCSFHYSL